MVSHVSRGRFSAQLAFEMTRPLCLTFAALLCRQKQKPSGRAVLTTTENTSEGSLVRARLGDPDAHVVQVESQHLRRAVSHSAFLHLVKH